MVKKPPAKEFPVFRNAPIEEAVLEIKFVTQGESNLERIGKFGERVTPASQRHQMFVGEFGVRMSLETGASIEKSETEIKGYTFRDEKLRRVVQLGFQSFSLHRLRPYEEWAKLRDEAKAIWTDYSQVMEVMGISRLGLRYINRIEVPIGDGSLEEFGEYLANPPSVAPDLDYPLEAFFMTLVLADEKRRAKANISQTSLEVTKDRTIPIILDIDVFKMLATNKDKSQDIWRHFEELRVFKNEIFYNSLTKKAKERFE